MNKIIKNTLEQTVFDWLEALGYNIEYGPDIAFDGSRPERNVEENYGNVILSSCLREKQYLR